MPVIFLKVRFETNALRHYYYYSPIMVKKGQIVLVNVYGDIKAVEVIGRYKKRPNDFDGEIKSIVGIGYMLNELTPQEPQGEPKSMLGSIISTLRKI